MGSSEALHFWALGAIPGVTKSTGASPATPKKLGIYINPTPALLPDPLQPVIDLLPRVERGCTVARLPDRRERLGVPGADRVRLRRRLPPRPRELVEAWYGAGV